LGKLDELGDAVRSVIRAFHGSPYDFDRFDASKIGTGEGAQAYGHGLYFAGSEPVAKTYRDQLSRNSFIVEGAATPMTEAMMDAIGIDTHAQGIIRRALRDGVDPIDRLEQMRSGYGPLSKHHNIMTDAIEVLRSAKGKLVPNQGRMYEVEIDHPESRLIDLDAPLDGDHKSAVLGAAFRAPDNKWQRMAIEEAASPTTPAQVALESIMRAHNSTLPNKVAGRLQSQAAVARDLLAEGVPGLKYLDGISRNAGDGTRNYVMFPGTEDSIRILRKYAIPGAVGAGAASQYGEE